MLNYEQIQKQTGLFRCDLGNMFEHRLCLQLQVLKHLFEPKLQHFLLASLLLTNNRTLAILAADLYMELHPVNLAFSL